MAQVQASPDNWHTVGLRSVDTMSSTESLTHTEGHGSRKIDYSLREMDCISPHR